jgi:predicted nucleotidyltransferase
VIITLIMSIDPYHNTVNSIKQFLRNRNIEIDKFYLFGSRARNDQSVDSDYDFMIVIKNDIYGIEKRTLTGDIYRHLMSKNELIVMDLIIKNEGIFNDESQQPGYLAHYVLKEGIEI